MCQSSSFSDFHLCHVLRYLIPTFCKSQFLHQFKANINSTHWLILPLVHCCICLHLFSFLLTFTHLILSFNLEFFPVSFSPGSSGGPYSWSQFLPFLLNCSHFPLLSKNRCCLSRLEELETSSWDPVRGWWLRGRLEIPLWSEKFRIVTLYRGFQYRKSWKYMSGFGSSYFGILCISAVMN